MTSGSASQRTKSAERNARRREAAERARRRRRTIWIASIAGVALLVLVAIVATRQPGADTSGASAGSVTAAVQKVPPSTLARVGLGSADPSVLTALPPDTPELTKDGKPEVLYVGAEYCPFCAAQRWPLVVALSRFGSFDGLGQSESSAIDVFPSTQTLTFHGATFASDVLSFTGVETASNQPTAGGTGYAPLERLTADQGRLLETYDAKPYTDQPGSIPFLMLGNRYVEVGAAFQPDVLQGMTHEQIVAALKDPTSDVAKAVDGTANVLTAAICQVTGGQPGDVCDASSITAVDLPTP